MYAWPVSPDPHYTHWSSVRLSLQELDRPRRAPRYKYMKKRPSKKQSNVLHIGVHCHQLHEIQHGSGSDSPKYISSWGTPSACQGKNVVVGTSQVSGTMAPTQFQWKSTNITTIHLAGATQQYTWNLSKDKPFSAICKYSLCANTRQIQPRMIQNVYIFAWELSARHGMRLPYYGNIKDLNWNLGI